MRGREKKTRLEDNCCSKMGGGGSGDPPSKKKQGRSNIGEVRIVPSRARSRGREDIGEEEGRQGFPPKEGSDAQKRSGNWARAIGGPGEKAGSWGGGRGMAVIPQPRKADKRGLEAPGAYIWGEKKKAYCR